MRTFEEKRPRRRPPGGTRRARTRAPEASETATNELAKIAASCRLEEARDYLGAIERCASQLRRNVNPRLALEVLVMDIPLPGGGKADGPPARTSVA